MPKAAVAIVLCAVLAITLAPATGASATGTTWRAPVSGEQSLREPCGDIAVFVAGSGDGGSDGAVALGAVTAGLAALDLGASDVRTIEPGGLLPSSDVLVGALATNTETPELSDALASWQQSASDWHAIIADSIDRCNEVVVAVGFDEGGLVLQSALSGFDNPLKIGGVVLIGNPARSYGTTLPFAGTTIGGALDGDGLYQLAMTAGLVPVLPTLDPAVSDYIVDACTSTDYVCDSSSLQQQRPDLTTWLGASSVTASHTQYGSVSSVLTATAMQHVGTNIGHRIVSLTSREMVSLEITQWATSTIDLTPKLPNGIAGEQWRLPSGAGLPNVVVGALTTSGKLIVAPKETFSAAGFFPEHRAPDGVWIRVTLNMIGTFSGSAPPVAATKSATPPVASGDAGKQACADYLFVGARGSGQSSQEGAGYGGEVAAVRDGLVDNVPTGKTLREVWLDYTAAPVSMMLTDPIGYQDSIADGVAQLTDVLIDSYTRCTDGTEGYTYGEKWVLAGYSQGALVDRITVAQLTNSASSRLQALTLIADPGRKPGPDSGIRNVGTGDENPLGVGVADLMPWNPILPNSLKSRIIHYCNQDDVVCDDYGQIVIPGNHVHDTYADDYLKSYRVGVAEATCATDPTFGNSECIANAAANADPRYVDDGILIDASAARGLSASYSRMKANSVVVTNRLDGGQDATWYFCNHAEHECSIKNSTRAPGTTNWSTPQVVGPATESIQGLLAVSTVTGKLVVTWTENEDDPIYKLPWPSSKPIPQAQIKALVRDFSGHWGVVESVSTWRSRSNGIANLRAGADGTVAISAISSGNCAPDDPDCTMPSASTRFAVAILGPSSNLFDSLTRVSDDFATPGVRNFSFQLGLLSDGAILVGWDQQPFVYIAQRNPQSGTWTAPSLVSAPALPPGENYGYQTVSSITEDNDGNAALLYFAKIGVTWTTSRSETRMVTISGGGQQSAQILDTSDRTQFFSVESPAGDVFLRQRYLGNDQFLYPDYLMESGWIESSHFDEQGINEPFWAPVSEHAPGVAGYWDSDINPSDQAITGSDGTIIYSFYHHDGPANSVVFRWSLLKPHATAWTQPVDGFASRLEGHNPQNLSAQMSGDGYLTLGITRAMTTGSTQLILKTIDPVVAPRQLRPVSVALVATSGGESAAVGRAITFTATTNVDPAVRGGIGTGSPGHFELLCGASIVDSEISSAVATLSAVIVAGGPNEFSAVWRPDDTMHIGVGTSNVVIVNAEKSTPTIAVSLGAAGSDGVVKSVAATVNPPESGLPNPSGSATLVLGGGDENQIAIGPVLLDGDGSVSFDVPSNLTPGTYSVAVSYGGDGAYVAASSVQLLSFAVPKAATTLGGIDALIERTLDDSAILDVSVLGGDSPTGSVTLQVSGRARVTVDLVGGLALVPVEAGVIPGDQTVLVEYSGDYLNAASSQSFTLRTSALGVLIPGTVTIIGDSMVGQVLTADPGEWSVPSTTFSYQWKANGSPIPDATNASFTVPVELADLTVVVTVTGTVSGYLPVTATSFGTEIVGEYFADVRLDNPFFTEIQWMFSSGLSTGTVQSEGKPLYKPSSAVSRQAMAAFLYRLSGSSFTPPVEPTFADVPTDYTFYTAIEWMAHEGISTGTAQPSGKPLFKPSDPVSRSAMALFLARYEHADLSGAPTTQRFADVPLNSGPAAAITWMWDNGISTGTTQPSGLPLYKPSDPVSRQAMAAFLYRVAHLP